MFAKKDPRPVRKEVSYPRAETRSDTTVAAPRARHTMPSILAEDIRITGDLNGDGEIQIEGSIEGNVRGATVTVGHSGSVSGTLQADSITISGKLDGEAKAKDVTLSDSARVNGNITVSGSFAIAPGAHFEGKAIRSEPEKVTKLPAYDPTRKSDDDSAMGKDSGLPKIAAKQA
jgi:cytoskeletal protein CcmA (bactofilin family)